MADDGAAEDAPITFNIRAGNDARFTVTVPLSLTVLQLKEKLSGEEYANAPVERLRLIYSGRVLKDPETLASYKIKAGNTVHMVKAAQSNERQSPSNQSTSSGGRGQTNPAVPTNLSSGPGANNPLAGLTGARYAGLAHLPNQSMFGPDGGVSTSRLLAIDGTS
jgi:ubiquilin